MTCARRVSTRVSKGTWTTKKGPTMEKLNRQEYELIMEVLFSMGLGLTVFLTAEERQKLIEIHDKFKRALVVTVVSAEIPEAEDE